MKRTITGTLRDRQSRLEALWDLGLAEQGSPEAQLRLVLDDALDAMGADYAEFGYASDDGFAVVASVGISMRDASATEIAIGRGVGALDGKPIMIFDTLSDRSDGEPVPFRSVLAWPFSTNNRRCSLGFGWHDVHDAFIAEDEMRYIDFLARVISRLLELVDHSRELSARITTDALTGLRNRDATIEQIAAVVSAAARGTTRAAVLYVDLDGFKAINDTRGHSFGDAVLAEAGKRLRGALRKHEFAGRMGGDEFAIVIPAFVADEELQEVAKRISRNLHQPIAEAGHTVELKASVGIAVYPDDARDAQALIDAADKAMYEAKRHRSQIEFASHEHAANELLAQLTPKISDTDARFIVCYQPIVESRTNKAVAVEALIRMVDDDGNVRPPAAFLQDAERNGTAAAVDRDVLDAILRQIGPAKNAGAIVPVHVNLGKTNEDLLRPDRDISGVAFELREDDAAADLDRHRAFIDACRARGVRVGLTNFGCGGLSLHVMSTLAIDFVKLGRNLVQGADFGSRSTSAARAAIDTAHRFGWTVIAENVETDMMREWFVANGADALQGFAICSPLTGPDMREWLRYHRAA